MFKKFEDISIVKNKEDKKDVPKKEKLTKEEKQKIKEQKKKHKEELKNLKKADKAIPLYTRDVMDFVDIDDEERLVMKYGYMNMYQIQTRDVHSLSENDIQRHIFSFISFLRGYTDDFKILSMNFPVNTMLQQQNIEKHLKYTTNAIAKKFLQRKLDELIYLEENRFNKEFYLMIFASSKEEFEDRERILYQNQNIAIRLESIEIDKKLKIIFKLNNLNTKLY